jgi:glutathionylspermidine synthase
VACRVIAARIEASSSSPWQSVEPLPPDVFAPLRRRIIFDCCKWDPQVEDVSTIADIPLVLPAHVWHELASLAELLAKEVMAAETELRQRPDLHGRLGLPRALKRVLGCSQGGNTTGTARIVRFDFHHTTEGWRISEANSDVPGGLNEASGLSSLMAEQYPGTAPAGDTAGAYSRAICSSLRAGAHVAFVHATAYSDDRQVMTYLARRFAACGVRTSLVSPAHLRWHGDRARLETAWSSETVDALVRFFPCEWLPNLPRVCGWPHFFGGGSTPVSNPASAILTQSKRFPLTWDALGTPMPTWRSLLPETRDPRDVPWRGSEEWVLKPALGRVGEDVGMIGVTEAKLLKRVSRDARWFPSSWVAQRRFAATALRVRGEDLYPSIGIYTIDGLAAGAYGRIAERPLIDGRARDAAVLVTTVHEQNDPNDPNATNDPNASYDERGMLQRVGA